jgi:hypothetical protein
MLPFVLVTTLSACHSFQPGTLSPGQNMTWNDQVRVTLASGEVVSLLNAQVQRDTLFGPPLYGRVDSIARYPVSSVRQIEARTFSGDRTAVVVVASVVGGALLLFAALLAALSGAWGS